MDHEFRPEKQRFLCSRKFSSGTTQKVVLDLLSNQIFRILFVNGKQPLFAPPTPPPSPIPLSNSSWVAQSTQEEKKTTVMQNFGE